ncbi:hypothetical protein Thena_0454 [Thermodesulfobium narugense DSM 14796]|uniref:Uncharacterized protein n=1 Tax=Thermodesulfobium narugense DSM 14796 TaxID=747365 RepID=M1E7P8_9BACT|nr:hypothetical protein [Thermodesulfobium narugense]AEE14094.1 hypothetical protein Thena_0454 [Thermodesulfobium narugense DSM 14796]
MRRTLISSLIILVFTLFSYNLAQAQNCFLQDSLIGYQIFQNIAANGFNSVQLTGECFGCINEPVATCTWKGQDIPLQHIQNVTVEGFRDAQLVGQCQLHAPGSCLNGEFINVFRAENEYPGKLLVHNGLQGPQCTYQTWIME